MVSPYTVSCPECDNWIEVIIVDEFYRPINNIESRVEYPWWSHRDKKLTSGSSCPSFHAWHNNLLSGDINLRANDDEQWLKEAQKNIKHGAKEDENIKQWLQDNPLGLGGKPREELDITAGDLLSESDREKLPENHRTSNVKLILGRSYVLKVKCFNYLTLRLGVFFDGTCNNQRNHEIGKPEILDWLKGYQTANKASRHEYRLGKKPDLDMSYANDLTNISKLYELYNTGELGSTHYSKTYVQGTGSSAEKKDDMLGSAFSEGKTSIANRVKEACEHAIINSIHEQLGNLLNNIDGYHRIEFDIFGFSRGAAAARYFSALVDMGIQESAFYEQNFFQYVPEIPKIQESFQNADKITLKTNFDWGGDGKEGDTNDWKEGENFEAKSDCVINFIGLFDSVRTSSELVKNGIIPQMTNMYLRPKIAKRVVQLVAADEFREHFALTRIIDTDKSKDNKDLRDISTVGINSSDYSSNEKIAKNFTEVILPGSHSDIGGGYYSRHSFTTEKQMIPNLDLTPLVTECVMIAKFTSIYPYADADALESSRGYLDAYNLAKARIAKGWASEIKIIHDQSEIEIGKINLLLSEPKHIGREYELLSVTIQVYLARVVEGELSRVALRVMYEAAISERLPLKDWDEMDPQFMIKPMNSSMLTVFNLKTFEDKVKDIATAKNKGKVIYAISMLTPEGYHRLRRYYCHYSANIAGFTNETAFHPNQAFGITGYDYSATITPTREIYSNDVKGQLL